MLNEYFWVPFSSKDLVELKKLALEKTEIINLTKRASASRQPNDRKHCFFYDFYTKISTILIQFLI